MQKRIVLADDLGLVRTGVKVLLQEHASAHVVGEASDGREAVNVARAECPDVVLMDIGMPRVNGLDAAAEITASSKAVTVVVFSQRADDDSIGSALRCGVKAYVTKSADETSLLAAIDLASTGRSFFSPDISARVEHIRATCAETQSDSVDLLTAREAEVLRLLASGRLNREIGSALGISLSTVETHRSHMMEKLNLHCVADLVRYAARKNIVC